MQSRVVIFASLAFEYVSLPCVRIGRRFITLDYTLILDYKLKSSDFIIYSRDSGHKLPVRIEQLAKLVGSYSLRQPEVGSATSLGAVESDSQVMRV